MTKGSYVLSLPKNISLQEDDSFSRDLLRQFDKRRSRLHFELGLLSEVLNVYSPNFGNLTFLYQKKKKKIGTFIRIIHGRRTYKRTIRRRRFIN